MYCEYNAQRHHYGVGDPPSSIGNPAKGRRTSSRPTPIRTHPILAHRAQQQIRAQHGQERDQRIHANLIPVPKHQRREHHKRRSQQGMALAGHETEQNHRHQNSQPAEHAAHRTQCHDIRAEHRNPHAQQQIIERRMHVNLQQIHHSGEWLALHNERIPLVEPDGTADAQRERPAGGGDRAYRRDTGKTMLRNGLSYRHGVVSLFIVQTYGGTSVLENAMAMVGIGVSHHSHAAWRMRHVSASPDRRRHAGSVP